jgi:hypothetical protein
LGGEVMATMTRGLLHVCAVCESVAELGMPCSYCEQLASEFEARRKALVRRNPYGIYEMQDQGSIACAVEVSPWALRLVDWVIRGRNPAYDLMRGAALGMAGAALSVAFVFGAWHLMRLVIALCCELAG